MTRKKISESLEKSLDEMSQELKAVKKSEDPVAAAPGGSPIIETPYFPIIKNRKQKTLKEKEQLSVREQAILGITLSLSVALAAFMINGLISTIRGI